MGQVLELRPPEAVEAKEQDHSGQSRRRSFHVSHKRQELQILLEAKRPREPGAGDRALEPVDTPRRVRGHEQVPRRLPEDPTAHGMVQQLSRDVELNLKRLFADPG